MIGAQMLDGESSPSGYFGGILDELLIMDNGLTVEQIHLLAQDGVNGVCQVEYAID